MEKVNTLVSQMLNEASSLKVEELRKEIIDIVFSYRKGEVFDALCEWDNSVKIRIEATKRGIEIPGNTTDILQVINLVKKLDLDYKS